MSGPEYRKGGSEPLQWVDDGWGHMVPYTPPDVMRDMSIESSRIAQEDAARKAAPRFDYDHMSYAALEWLERTGGWDR